VSRVDGGILVVPIDDQRVRLHCVGGIGYLGRLLIVLHVGRKLIWKSAVAGVVGKAGRCVQARSNRDVGWDNARKRREGCPQKEAESEVMVNRN
jgi:hypothetical protein